MGIKMFFIAVIELILIFICAEQSINEGLPDRIPRDKGWIDYSYRLLRMLGVRLAIGCRLYIVGIILFIIAYGIKKIFWKKRYGHYLD